MPALAHPEFSNLDSDRDVVHFYRFTKYQYENIKVFYQGKFDRLVKSRESPRFVIPVKPVPDPDPGAGFQLFQDVLDPRISSGCRQQDFLRNRQI